MEETNTSTPVVRAQRRLRELGQRATPARLAVLASLAENPDQHLGATDVADRCGGLHRATVYRALTTLCELGLVTHTHTSGAGAVYHLDPSVPAPEHAHAHLECRVCRRLTDVPTALLAPLAASLVDSHAFVLEPDHATLLGVCASCREAPTPDPALRS